MNDIYKAYKNTFHPLHKDHPNKKTPPQVPSLILFYMLYFVHLNYVIYKLKL